MIVTGNEQTAHTWLDRFRATTTESVALARGPYAVPHRSKNRPTRWIWLLPIPKNDYLVWRNSLASVARGVIVDLDPVAFFM